ncbi:LPXTG cell wall anchor domain-containing protein [Gracilibacillus caseinilyticus]|uniref:LPXTG cell wall anchor domain-containing protein n=1 Tax=Gracilibacillus caseinilyticus TaxID=2932256 RepID=A0ABY4F105_9BACI|nr:LPXTG cell wall anchor domain-containing protein [Gracilibacillus caseinilyticus]UOQ50362.1 LPXTG cell wall anchor domain-containing protein [Gracilibacillus caseinilyticus]
MTKPKLFYSIFLLFFLFSVPIVQATTNQNLINLDGTFAENGKLFDLTNLKPGDWADREMTISNQVDHDISYTIDIQHLDGSELFYNQLSLKIQHADAILFDDKISNFSLLADLTLPPDSTDNLAFTLTFPPESGNEFQGLMTNAEIIITAFDDMESETSSFAISTNSDNGALLPSTATNIINLVIIGAFLLLLGQLFLLYIKWNKRAKE